MPNNAPPIHRASLTTNRYMNCVSASVAHAATCSTACFSAGQFCRQSHPFGMLLVRHVVHIPPSQERRARMFLEQINPPDVAPQRVEALVTAYF